MLVLKVGTMGRISFSALKVLDIRWPSTFSTMSYESDPLILGLPMGVLMGRASPSIVENATEQ